MAESVAKQTATNWTPFLALSGLWIVLSLAVEMESWRGLVVTLAFSIALATTFRLGIQAQNEVLSLVRE